MFYITEEMRQTYAIHDKFSIFLDYAAFVQSEWNEWAVYKIESIVVYGVR